MTGGMKMEPKDANGIRPVESDDARPERSSSALDANGGVPPSTGTLDEDQRESQLKALEAAERAVESAYHSGKAERSKITQAAQLDAAEAVAMAGIAMESDEEADEAIRMTIIAERSGNKESIKRARQRERQARRKATADHRAATRSARKAYDAIRFSAPNRLGFMRFVQAICAIHIFITLTVLVFTSRDELVYSYHSLFEWFGVIVDGVALWFFINRYRITKPFMIGTCLYNILVAVVSQLQLDSFDLWTTGYTGTFYLLIILYFLCSKRVKVSMVNRLALKNGDYEERDFTVARSGWPLLRNLIIYFIVFSILGHWMELAFCELIRMGLVEGDYDPTNTMLWRDVFFPFSMEGAAVVIIALFLYPLWVWLRKKLPNLIVAAVVSFLVNMLLCASIEFFSGLIVNADLSLWNYSDMPFNIMGQVCLQNALSFGVASSIITWFIYPLLEYLIAKVPRDVMNIVFVVILAFGVIIYAMYVIDLSGFSPFAGSSTGDPDVVLELQS